MTTHYETQIVVMHYTILMLPLTLRKILWSWSYFVL